MIQKKILILRFSSMGDILLATPVIDLLKEKFEGCQIDWIVKHSFKGALSNHPGIHRLYDFSNKAELKKIRDKVFLEGYDYIFDLHINLNTRFIKKAFDKKKVFNYRKRVLDRFLLVYFKKPYKTIMPVTRMYFAALEKAGISTSHILKWNLSFFIRPEVEEKTLQEQRLDNKDYIVIAPGASYATKMWPKEYFRELIIKYNKKVVLLGKGEVDERVCAFISKGLNHCTNLSGKLSLESSAAVIKHSKGIVSNDSGLLHMAECFKRPAIAFFGCTTEALGFFPYATPSAIFENNSITCRPCTHFGKTKCPKGHFYCMKSISVDLVLQKLERIEQLSDLIINQGKP